MNAAMLLQHTAGVIEHRERSYGPPSESFEAIAARWSLVLGVTVTSAQVALCLADRCASSRRRGSWWRRWGCWRGGMGMGNAEVEQ